MKSQDSLNHFVGNLHLLLLFNLILPHKLRFQQLRRQQPTQPPKNPYFLLNLLLRTYIPDVFHKICKTDSVFKYFMLTIIGELIIDHFYYFGQYCIKVKDFVFIGGPVEMDEVRKAKERQFINSFAIICALLKPVITPFVEYRHS